MSEDKQELNNPFTVDEHLEDEKPSKKTASKLNRGVILKVAGAVFGVAALLIMLWSMKSQTTQTVSDKQAAQKAQQKDVVVDLKKAEDEAKQRDKDARTKQKKRAKKKAPKQTPKQPVVSKTPEPSLTTRYAPAPAPQNPVVQPPMQPSMGAVGPQKRINPWRAARQSYNQQRAQQHYQLRAQARRAPMQVFGPDGTDTSRQTQTTAFQPTNSSVMGDEQAFIARLNQARAQKLAMARAAQSQAKPQLRQPSKPTMAMVGASNRHQEQFFGAPMQPSDVEHLQGDMVATGTIVSVVLETGLNSELPGMIFGVVASPVYDPTMTRIMIPSGARLVGQYNARVQQGQTRAQVRWSRLVFPDGRSLALPNLPGVDFAGYSGFEASVDEHWGRIALGALISASFSSAAGVFGGPTSQFNVEPKQQALYGAFKPFQETGQAIAERFLNVEPTLTVEAGRLVGMLVTQDLIIPRSGGQ